MDLRSSPQSLDQDMSMRRGFCLLKGNFPVTDELLNKRMIFSELFNLAISHPIDATIPNMTDTSLSSTFFKQHGSNGRSHAVQFRTLTARGKNAAIRSLGGN